MAELISALYRFRDRSAGLLEEQWFWVRDFDRHARLLADRAARAGRLRSDTRSKQRCPALVPHEAYLFCNRHNWAGRGTGEPATSVPYKHGFLACAANGATGPFLPFGRSRSWNNQQHHTDRDRECAKQDGDDDDRDETEDEQNRDELTRWQTGCAARALHPEASISYRLAGSKAFFDLTNNPKEGHMSRLGLFRPASTPSRTRVIRTHQRQIGCARFQLERDSCTSH
jgi:hypothetical protein